MGWLPQDGNEAEHPNEHEHDRNRHCDWPHGVIGKILLRKPFQDTGVLNGCGEQTEDAN
jgi:hypothetical protein